MTPAGLSDLLSPEGWPYASSLPTGADDPGRYHALFGRDALITALQVLPARPDVARAALRALASLQGEREDPETDEEPGKIVHEYRPRAEPRFAEQGWPVRDGRLVYYGSADATSWFLVVLARLADHALTGELESAWRAAAGWLERTIARGEGLVRHGPRTASGGLVQQGWRDTSDPRGPDGGGILRPDGSVPAAPLADADSQAIAVAALDATAALSGDARWSEQAERMRSLIADRFTPDTIAVDGRDARVPGAGSHIGWLLWAGALPADARDAFAQRLVQPDVLTDAGLRTLSREHPQFAPDAYHRGAVWPFDSWLGWGGLRAAGRPAEAERVRRGVLDAVRALGGAPELYAVTPTGVRRPAIANRVQAWTIGARWALEQRWDGGGSIADRRT